MWWSGSTASCTRITVRKLFLSIAIPQIFSCPFWEEGSNFLSCFFFPTKINSPWLRVLECAAQLSVGARQCVCVLSPRTALFAPFCCIKGLEFSRSKGSYGPPGPTPYFYT